MPRDSRDREWNSHDLPILIDTQAYHPRRGSIIHTLVIGIVKYPSILCPGRRALIPTGLALIERRESNTKFRTRGEQSRTGRDGVHRDKGKEHIEIEKNEYGQGKTSKREKRMNGSLNGWRMLKGESGSFILIFVDLDTSEDTRVVATPRIIGSPTLTDAQKAMATRWEMAGPTTINIMMTCRREATARRISGRVATDIDMVSIGVIEGINMK
ncbi:hypothetical protein F4782DRAFT_527644 [Xylaria castorea]|nr:hypothetical protein F4782DRAFT_527644 [Xylaria castorea]